jgi:hypothetical protein
VTKKEADLILGYSERHHIIPKCMGGDNTPDNLCFLSAREHFIAHFLLIKIYPKEHKLIYACHRLAFDKQGNRIKSSKIYDSIKTTNSNIRKSFNKYNCEGVKRQSEKLTGRTKETHRGLQIISEKKKGKTKENDISVRKMSETKTGRTKETHDGTRRQSEKLTGRTKETHKGLQITSEKKSKLTLQTKIKLVELRDNGYSVKEIKEWVQENFPDYVEVSLSGLYKSIANTRKYLKNV